MADPYVTLQMEFRRARVALDWNGAVRDLMGFEARVGETLVLGRLDDVSDFEWSRGIWIPWREL